MCIFIEKLIQSILVKFNKIFYKMIVFLNNYLYIGVQSGFIWINCGRKRGSWYCQKCIRGKKYATITLTMFVRVPFKEASLNAGFFKNCS